MSITFTVLINHFHLVKFILYNNYDRAYENIRCREFVIRDLL